MTNKQNWYDIKAEAAGNPQVYIYGVIVDYQWDADDMSPAEFIRAINGLGDFDLHVNTPGGSVVAGLAIYNAIRRHKGTVTAYVDSIAASMGSVIIMAADKIVMPANALLMIHDPWTVAVGNADDMRKQADVMDKFKAGLVAAYHDKTGMAVADIEKMMTDESWITAAEAVEFGFADQVESPIQAAASFDLTRYRNASDALFRAEAQAKKEPPMTLEEIKAKYPEHVAAIAADATLGHIPMEQAQALATDTSKATTANILALIEATLGAEVREKFAALVEADIAPEHVQALGISVLPQAAAPPDALGGTAAAMLAAITAAAPKPAAPAGAPATSAGISTSAIYRARNQAMTAKK